MAQIRELKKRMVAVRTIQRITKTMQMIATAKFNAALQRARASRAYTDTLRRLVEEVSSAAGDVSHPLLEGPSTPSGVVTVVVITSDRGLCGAFNGQVLRKAEKLCREITTSGKKLQLLVAGKKGVAFFKFAKIPAARTFSFGDKPTFEDAGRLADEVMDDFINGRSDALHVVYMRFVRAAKQVPEAAQVLPIVKPAAAAGSVAKAGSPMEFSPSAEKILTDLLPRAVRIQLFQSFLDSAVSEQAMRRVAMKAATDNATSLVRLLKRNFNRARQAKITTELTEIISGVSALS
ncbi:MAG: ATP synthase F1 subunit gamma [Phycisphaerae bacterium]|nr:ATP synthase F1 subunit gamma [Phycisphaerae bacterium]